MSSARASVLGGAEARSLPAARWRLAELDLAPEPPLAVFPPFDLEEVEADEAWEPALEPEGEAHEPTPAEAPDPRGFEAQLRLAEEHRAALERAEAEAHARGVEEGRRLGEEGEAARLRSAVLAAEAALEEMRMGEMRWTGSIEENICALAVAVARQVIGRELRGDVESVVELVRGALAEFPVDQPIRIRVSPGDLAAIQAGSEEGAMALTRDRDARWLPDPRIGAGGCVVEGRERIVDGRVDTALERIYRRLTYNHG